MLLRKMQTLRTYYLDFLPMTISTQGKIQRLEGLLETHDLNDWEHGFVQTLSRHLHAGTVSELSEPQLENMNRLFDKHFGG
jgi:hypothetical protein